MVNRNVRLKNLDGDYLYPYTDNIPTASTSVAGKVKLETSPVSGSGNVITSGAVYTALANKLDKTATAVKATSDANGNNIASTYALKRVAVTTLTQYIKFLKIFVKFAVVHYTIPLRMPLL